MNQAFLDYYRCPEIFAKFGWRSSTTADIQPSFFRFGKDAVVYGRAAYPESEVAGGQHVDMLAYVEHGTDRCHLPFDPSEVAENMRHERYVPRTKPPAWKRLQRQVYYTMRPMLTTRLRRHLQKASLKGWQDRQFPSWPVDRSVDRMFDQLMALSVASTAEQRVPFIWFWPRGYSGCAIMTHDVETAAGLAFTGDLKRINASFQIPASYQLIPGARYEVTAEVLNRLTSRDSEVNVHDLKHDGHLFDKVEGFEAAAKKINGYAEKFGAKGFRAGVLYRNQSWFNNLRVSYDMSVPNVAHLDPQKGGCCTVMPYFIGDVLELPVTATQDYTLFNILETYSHDLWQQQIKLVLEQHGLLNFIVHPDYLDSPEAIACYTGLLAELSRLRAESALWIPLPRDVDQWWRQRSAMNLVQDKQGWRVEGDGAERACIAYATLRNGELSYDFS